MNIKSLCLFGLSLFFTLPVLGQKEISFSAEVAQDTLLAGNIVQVVFKLENGKGTGFEPPIFEKFEIVQGPSTQSYFSMVNGEVSQSLSFTYWIKPKEEGILYIEPASISVEEKIIETKILNIVVLPNPDGKVEDPSPLIDNDFFKEIMPKSTPKKKRKTTKL
ncbi:MAG: hypothetical protein RJA52_719 [Bacteroidota bacterium]|jgi:hypothetical protein